MAGTLSIRKRRSPARPRRPVADSATAALLPAARPCYKRASQLWGAGVPTVFVLNGPNLNLLGVRDPAVYGLDTLSDIEARCLARAAGLEVQIEFRQSNHEGQLVDWIHEARESADGIVLNAGALTHTSVAILDALLASELPVIEVHLSNIFRRERFRHHSYVSLAATGVICGLGAQGYELALEAIAALMEGEPVGAGR
jgi:3-dehydroquinate dehydratase-2